MNRRGFITRLAAVLAAAIGLSPSEDPAPTLAGGYDLSFRYGPDPLPPGTWVHIRTRILPDGSRLTWTEYGPREQRFWLGR